MRWTEHDPIIVGIWYVFNVQYLLAQKITTQSIRGVDKYNDIGINSCQIISHTWELIQFSCLGIVLRAT